MSKAWAVWVKEGDGEPSFDTGWFIDKSTDEPYEMVAMYLHEQDAIDCARSFLPRFTARHVPVEIPEPEAGA